MRIARSILAGLVVAATTSAAAPSAAERERADFRALYKTMVETDTTRSSGDCTVLARGVAQRLEDAGLPATDIHVIVAPGRPKQGNLLAFLRGAEPTRKPILLLAHIDVVEAKREDWLHDPFTLVEEDDYFYGRGTADDKAMAAIFVDLMERYARKRYAPKRGIKLALTCGEETPGDFDGAKYIVENHRDLIDAEFALNEGAYGRLDGAGRRVYNGVQAGEKIYQDYRLEVVNPGGHSSRPVKDNAIYRLAAALRQIRAHEFPIEFNAATRTYFERMAAIETGQLAADMRAILATPPDPAALERIVADPSHNAILRTTCVATMLDAGHAPNALPQRAAANLNCRILPGHRQETVLSELEAVIADAEVRVSYAGAPETVSPPPPLTKEILGPIERITAEMWPGVPVVPSMAAGATDGRFLTGAGIPTYGVSGIFMDPASTNAHGRNERLKVQSLYQGREFLQRLVEIYANE
jgi:acetylornithine deacetylase/succinyl-diaminopimelate desuccinylase-like protein